MSWRFLYIKNADKLNINLDNLIITQDGKESNIPLSDINTILIEDYKTVITSRLMAKIVEFKIQLVVCDNSMLPCAILTPIGKYHREYKMQKKQLSLNQDIKNKLWANIIKEKISNQLIVMKEFSKNKDKEDILSTFIKEVEDGDITNREGLAAKIYFRELFGENFSRNNEDTIINASLNYGYTIIRNCFCRAIVGLGLIPSIGIFHKNEYNSFNLADDLMEVYRPLIDRWIKININEQQFLDKNIKLRLVNILNGTIRYGNEDITVNNSIEKYVKKVFNHIENENSQIIFPDILSFIEDEL